MNKPFDDQWEELRRQVLGLGEGSVRKSHYPSLRQRLQELERFRSMVDLSGDLLLVVDSERRDIIDCNRTACERIGRNRAELVGLSLGDLLQREALQMLDGIFADTHRPCMHKQTMLLSELPSSEGATFPAEITVSCGKSGGHSYAVLAARDITDRRKSEEQLRQIATVFKSTQEGVLITDRNSQIQMVNPAFSTISGYTEEEVIGKKPDLLKSGRHDRNFYQTMWRDILATDYWQGEIHNRRKSGEIYPAWMTISTIRDELGEVANYVGIFSDLTRIKRSEFQLDHLVHHDALTDLPNPLLLRSRLTHAIGLARRAGKKGAVLYLDLDRFKTVNDSLGHSVGDELLQIVAGRLRNRLREADTLARLGGDEFIVLLEDLADPRAAAEVAQGLIEQLVRPIMLTSGRELYITASIGISLFPDDGESAEQLIQHADAALNEAKNAGRNTYCFYTRALTRAANERLAMEAALRHAVDDGEFVLYFQPLVSLADAYIYGLEALVRWCKPDGELVPPARFIGLAEETGLITGLGEWVLREACTRMNGWLEAGLKLNSIAVNLSPLQFRQHGIDRRIERILEETGLPGRYLELEITEGTIMEAVQQSEVTLAALKALGIRIAVDDFGTGYSSLAYLKRFPIDKLKIDQTFIRDIPQDASDMEIVSAIVAMSNRLNLESLAEGVETEEQRGFLCRLGCDSGQGYLFSRPVPAEAVPALFVDAPSVSTSRLVE